MLIGVWYGWSLAAGIGADTFTVASYNLDNYLEQPQGGREAKSAAAKAKVRESIRVMAPDVLALQEIGPPATLHELRQSLKADGIDYPHWEHVAGFDTNIFVAVLSRFPIIERRPHARMSYLLNGRRLFVSRGFAEIDIRINDHYTFTLLTAHLKSRRPVGIADEADMREQEALCLREIIDRRLKANPRSNLIVVGDLNDTKAAASTKIVVGRGTRALWDCRPAERNGDDALPAQAGFDPRQVTWTHFYGKEDTYSRIDYLLLSQGLVREWDPAGTYVLSLPNWGLASDHRPIIARFMAQDQ